MQVLKDLHEGRTRNFDELHQEQTAKFGEALRKHEEKLTAIEDAYNQKLALQKPVDYWRTKETHHRKRSVVWGIAAISTLLVLAGSLGIAVYEILSPLQSKEDPKHWQIGILLVGMFFSIWVIRVLVRIFLSHLHLATDAAERLMMILTYLSISREGAQYSSDDKKLILSNIFRTASDGLVKDDAAPPTPLEILSRSRS